MIEVPENAGDHPISAIAPVDVVNFWRAAGPSHWFVRDDAFDAIIRQRFLSTWQAAAGARLAAWEATDEGLLAMIIVLDQFPRNMFRNDAQAYSTDPLALNFANRAIARGIDQRIDPLLTPFVYMPLMHSEALSDQKRCVALFRDFNRDGKASDNLEYAELHAYIIERFGRFPHRNRVLGRTTTPEEQAFLNGGGFSG